MSDAPATAPKPAKGKKLMFAIVFLIIAGGAGGGFWFWRQSNAAAAGHEPAPKAEGPGAVLNLEPFLVNLADADASRFLRATIRLVVKDESSAKEFEHNDVHKVQLRSAILELLTTQKSGALVTPEGKTALKQAIATRATEVLKLEVSDVLFTDFVVQF